MNNKTVACCVYFVCSLLNMVAGIVFLQVEVPHFKTSAAICLVLAVIFAFIAGFILGEEK